MLSYTISEDGNRAVIDPCSGGIVRLSIIRLCQTNGWDIPPETLDENADIEELREINTALLIRRSRTRIERSRQEQATRAKAAPPLSPEVAAKAASLRERAREIRQFAQYADDYGAYTAEIAAATWLEAEADRLEDPHAARAVDVSPPPAPQHIDEDLCW